MVYMAITGGGQTFIGDYLSISGASKTVVGAIVPYSQAVFDKFVGRKMETYCSQEAATKLAIAAFKECQAGMPKTTSALHAMGLGVTCSLAKDDEREGREHKAFLCIHRDTYTLVQSLILKQGRTRQHEEQMVCRMIECALANEIIGFDRKDIPFIELRDGETFSSRVASISDVLRIPPSPKNTDDPIVVYPGSWNPFHAGHAEVIKVAEEVLGKKPILELSMVNVDKGILDYIDIQDRINTLPKDIYFNVTEDATFKQKVINLKRRFPANRIIFVVGADTWNRIWNEKYGEPLLELEDFFRNYYVSFLVFGRAGNIIRTDWGDDLRIISKKAESLNSSISSTEIRNQNAKSANTSK